MAVKFVNNYSTTLSSSITGGQTTMIVDDVTGLPTISGSDYMYLTLSNALGTAIEIVKVTGISGNTLTITRAQDNTSALAWQVGTIVEGRVNAALLTDVTTNVNSGYFNFTPMTAPIYQEGRVWYDSNYKALSYYNDITNSSMQIGFENWIRVRNQTGSLVPNGTVVVISGATGQTPTIALADADLHSASQVMGIVTEDIANNGFGNVTTFGEVRDLDTSAFADGDVVYVSNTAGQLTKTAPTTGSIIAVGIVSYSHANQGKINVSVNDAKPYLPISGGTLTGSLAVTGGVLVTGTLSSGTYTLSTSAGLPMQIDMSAGSSGVAPAIGYKGNAAQYNWRVGANIIANNAFEIVPSTTVGGASFSTPVASFTTSGLSVTGALTATGQVLGKFASSVDSNAAFESNSGASGITAYHAQNNGGYGCFFGYDNTNRYPVNGAAVRNRANSPLYFETNNTLRMTLDASGNLLVGTTSVGSAVATGGAQVYVDAYGTGQTVFDIGHISGTATGTPYQRYFYNGLSVGSVTQNGTTAVAYNTTSDHRLKNNVRDADAKSFDKIRFVDFEWIDGRHDCGVIAHELQAIYPDLVVGEKDAEDEEGNAKYQQVNYIGLIPRMGVIIQRQMQQIADLEARLAALESK